MKTLKENNSILKEESLIAYKQIKAIYSHQYPKASKLCDLHK